jgi:hypothetical protein
MITKTVDTSVICSWLGIPADQWPPDHYTLLGLKQGEKELDLIERAVQQRMETVRRYQIANPDAATEAMNRLAQAFVCLTDEGARAQYDRALFGDQAPESEPTQTSPAAPTAEIVAALPLPEAIPLEVKDVLPPAPAPAAPVEPTPKRTISKAGRRGLGTKRALYERVVLTRALSRLWEHAGKYLGNPRRRLARPAEAREVIELFAALQEDLEDFPKILGEAGLPGYLVVSL